MPEGDTVWRTARRLHQALAGRAIVTADLRWPELSTADLTGMTTTDVLSRGKNILHRLDSGLTLHSHLRMEGEWRIRASPTVSAGALGNPQIRAVVGSEQWIALGLRLGDLHLVPTSAEARLVGHLGPDVLGPDWDPVEAARRIAATDTAIGAALLDQRNLAGVGTLYASELLFLERVGPWRAVADLTPDQIADLLRRVHRLLDANRHQPVQSTTGRSRRDENTHAHGRSGRPCRRCGDIIRVAVIGEAPRQRTLFYCPRCQGGLAPTDDGRAQRPLGSSVPTTRRQR